VKRAILAALACASAVCLLSGCPDNPYSADTWIPKLDDPKDLDEAVTKLQELCDPKAIPALGKAWEKNNRPTRILQAIVDLAQPLSPGPGGTADTKNCTDFVKSGRFWDGDAATGHGTTDGWQLALPFLREAIEDVDTASTQKVDDAVKAAEALGTAMLPDAAQILIDAINKKMNPKDNGQRIRLSAIASLEKYTDPATKKLAITTLAAVVRADQSSQPPNIVGAAINTLGNMKSADALPVLLDAMYTVPLFFQQVHRALVNSGAPAIEEVRKILRHERADTNALFKDKKLDKYCGDKGDAAPSECQDNSAMDYYAAIVLGDLYDKGSVADLLTALGRPLKPAYYSDFNPGPPAQNAVIDALRKIGDPSAADAILKIVADPKADEQLKPVAAGAYGFISVDGSEKAGSDTGLSLMGKIAADNKADQALRLAASESYGRLAKSKDQIKLLQDEAKKYADASAKARGQADGDPKKVFDAANAKFEAANKALTDAKAAVEKAKAAAGGAVENVPADILNAATKAKDDFDKVKKEVYIPAKDKFDSLDQAAKGYLGYERGFEDHIAKIEIAQHCAGDVNCLVGTFDADPKAILARLKAGYITSTGDWNDDDLADLKTAQIERAILELRKQGAGAKAALPKLLEHLKDTDRLVRQSILLALPRIAPLPCDDCKAKLDEAVQAGQAKQELSELTYETQLMAAFYAWAGKK